MFSRLILCCVISFIFSDGIVEYGSFYSQSLDQNRNYTIYLPEGYYQSDEEYPVIYFLHGFGGTNNSYNAFHSSLNSMMSDDTIMDMIVVSADGSTDLYSGSFYTNSILNGNYEDYIAYDLVNHIDDSFRTLAMREFRALSPRFARREILPARIRKKIQIFTDCGEREKSFSYES